MVAGSPPGCPVSSSYLPAGMASLFDDWPSGEDRVGAPLTAVVEPVAEATTWRTLADISDEPPGELLFGMLEPDSPTLAYAAPSTGKGTTGAYLVCEALNHGMKPLIFDAERHPREWARRVSGLGGDRSKVVYVEPNDLGPQLAGRPFWEVEDAVKNIISATGADMFLLDSLLPASGLGEERLKSDAQAPFLFVSALAALDIPSLSFGHPPKGQPEGEPFGSMAWVAAFRLTLLGTKAEGSGHNVRWRFKKRNERGHVPGVLLSFGYSDDGRLNSVERSDDTESTRDWLLVELVHGDKAVSEMAEGMFNEMDDPPNGELERIQERLKKALWRMEKEGFVEKLGTTGSNVKWRLRTRP